MRAHATTLKNSALHQTGMVKCSAAYHKEPGTGIAVSNSLRFSWQGLVAGAVHLLLRVKAAEVQLLAVLPDVRLISSGPAWRRVRVCGLRSAHLSILYAGMRTAVPAVVRDAAVVRAGYTQAVRLALRAHFGPAYLTVVCTLAAMMQLEG